MLERATDGFARRTRLLLDLADMMAGATPLTVTSVDVSALVRAAASEMSEMARLARSSMALTVAPGLVALANADALRQVLSHILTNALRFGAGRPVRLSVHQEPQGRVVITVSDQGPGIDPAKAARLFALFRQARTPLEPGLGIGLWVAAQLVAAMGGAIGVASEAGEGAHFHVSLPPPQDASVASSTQNLQTRHETGVSEAGAI
jgi:signal transduction histidine kinase